MKSDYPVRVYHHHLIKCGGTTLNGWLDQQTDDVRALNQDWLLRDTAASVDAPELSRVADLADVVRRRGVAAFYWSDVIYSQQALSCFAPPGTLRMTVLRDPVSRLISHVSDIRRLSDADTARFDPQLHDCFSDARRLRLGAFLERHGRGVAGYLFDNYLVRAIAATRLGPLQPSGDAADLVVIARLSLDEDYELVGITEQADRVRLALCRRLGWAPAPDAPRLNAAGTDADGQEVAEAAAVLADLTVHDAALYARARARFEAEDAAYDTASFEADAASRRVGVLRGQWSEGGRTSYSVHGPLIGSGWHGRDGAGTPECAVWTGPGPVATLYMPAPPGQDITVYLWVRGYAAAEQRNALRLRIDGRPVAHRFEHEETYQDVVAADIATTRDFVRVEIDVGNTLTTGVPGTLDHDPRLRGLAFDRYGWSVR